MVVYPRKVTLADKYSAFRLHTYQFPWIETYWIHINNINFGEKTGNTPTVTYWLPARELFCLGCVISHLFAQMVTPKSTTIFLTLPQLSPSWFYFSPSMKVVVYGSIPYTCIHWLYLHEMGITPSYILQISSGFQLISISHKHGNFIVVKMDFYILFLLLVTSIVLYMK